MSRHVACWNSLPVNEPAQFEMFRTRQLNVSRCGFDFLLEFLGTEEGGNGEKRIQAVASPARAKELLSKLREHVHRYEHFVGPIMAESCPTGETSRDRLNDPSAVMETEFD